MNKVIALQNQIEFYMEQGGDVDSYLRKFGNLSTYRGSPYFKAATEENRKDLMEAEELGSEAQKNANDNVVRTLENQQEALRPIWKRFRPTPRVPRGAWRPSSTQISWPATRPTSCFNLGAF